MRSSSFAVRLSVLGVLLAVVVGACSPAATPTAAPTAVPATAVPATAAPQPTAAPAKVTIHWWHISTVADQKALFQKRADEYQAAHPNVTIEITVLENEAFKSKLTTVMQSGDPPDLFQSWGGGVMNQYADAGLLKDITPDLAQNGWGASFGPGALAVYSYNGKNYGVPRDFGMVGFWYNKDLFAKAGIQAPPATWTDFLSDVKTLKTAGIMPIALGEKDKWPGAFWWEYLAVRLGGQAAFTAAVTRKGAFTDPPFIDAGQKLADLVALQPFQDGFLGAVFNDESALMGNGKAAMELMGQWAEGNQNDQSVDKKGIGDKLGWFPFPTLDGEKGNPTDALGGGNGFIVGKNATPEAVDFLRYLTSVDAQRDEAKIGMAVPVVKGAEAAL